MAENIQRTGGQPKSYKFDRGNKPTEFGPFIGEVMNNVDPTRGGRLQVYIEQFAGPDKQNTTLWRTVSYCPSFYGTTPHSGTSAGSGSYPGNPTSYGMWATAPDIGVKVICFFIAGDPNQGYYLGCVPDQGMNAMIPAMGSSETKVTQNESQSAYLSSSKRLPVTEMNNAAQNTENVENPQFFNSKKPVQGYGTAVMFQQGLTDDAVRGTITSSAQRESPSQVHGWSTPGRAIYQGGKADEQLAADVKTGNASVQSANVISRRGGHSIVMDDGDLKGTDNLIRIRSSKGHQIMLSDSGDCVYITHGNGQTWIELGVEGTVDLYSTNSVNIRSQGMINLHADQDINMYAGGAINMKSTTSTTLQSDGNFTCANKGELTLFSESKVGVKSMGVMAMKSTRASIDGGSSLSLKAARIDLNGGATIPVDTPKGLTTYTMPETTFDNSSGWSTTPDDIESVCTRAPTHEPYPYHNKGVQSSVSLTPGQPSSPPDAPAVPSGVSITKTS